MRLRSQILGQKAYVLIGMIVTDGESRISHQRANIAYQAVRLWVFLQPCQKLSHKISPSHPQASGMQFLQKLYRPLGQTPICQPIIPAVLQDTSAQQRKLPAKPLKQPGRPTARFMYRNLHHPKFPGFRKHTAHHGPGDTQFPRNITLLLIFQIITPGHICQTLPFLIGQFHTALPSPAA